MRYELIQVYESSIHLFLQSTGSYADATELPASTPDDEVVVTAVLKKELLSPEKSQGNGAFSKGSRRTVCLFACNVKFVISQPFNKAGDLPGH